MFCPESVFFSPTSRCNAHCSHCRTTKVPVDLDVDAARVFLIRCAEAGITSVGFSGGGEPFLAPECVAALVHTALELDMNFDRLMTNGMWWTDNGTLRKNLRMIFDAGFDGRIGFSYDTYHGQNCDAAYSFIQAALDESQGNAGLEIIAVRSPDDGVLFTSIETIARRFGAHIETTAAAGREEPVGLIHNVRRILIPITWLPYSASPRAAAWTSSEWFCDDYCSGPGNMFFVHADGRVAVCCGFANEHPALIAGTVRDTYEQLMNAVSAHPYMRMCYELGLGAARKRLEAKGVMFPGMTDDMCFFCAWLLEHGMDLL